MPDDNRALDYHQDQSREQHVQPDVAQLCEERKTFRINRHHPADGQNSPPNYNGKEAQCDYQLRNGHDERTHDGDDVVDETSTMYCRPKADRNRKQPRSGSSLRW